MGIGAEVELLLGKRVGGKRELGREDGPEAGGSEAGRRREGARLPGSWPGGDPPLVEVRGGRAVPAPETAPRPVPGAGEPGAEAEGGRAPGSRAWLPSRPGRLAPSAP